ncbi:hypothetical protein [Alishewanella aestuarii]|uniref:hypothetical protein n=1 Tax=Alishewanella aestuarii TaxID=453835 RepID=UPI000587AD2B|nr:hypothetical protein [Alishewanella aestuarii]
MTSQDVGKYTVEDTHNALRNAVRKALERKKKLGHYSVMWQANRLVLEGPDAPVLTKPSGSDTE